MTATIFVAIDIVEDQVVRLRRGELSERTVYGHDALTTAIEWESKGAEWLHVVDLDGATKGEQGNSRAVEAIVSKVKIPVQVAGGIRSLESIERWIGLGATRVVIGTKALDREFLSQAVSNFGESVVAAIDARAGEVRVAGWTKGSGRATAEILKQVAQAGVPRVLFTDIERDGTLTGPNFEAVEEVLSLLNVPVIASGGVTTEGDVRRLASLVPKGLEGMIIGKALYSGGLRLEDALGAASEA